MVKTSLSVQKVPCPPRHSGDLSLALRQHVSLCGVIPREHPCGTKMHGRHGDTGEVSGGMICKHGLPNPLSKKVNGEGWNIYHWEFSKAARASVRAASREAWLWKPGCWEGRTGGLGETGAEGKSLCRYLNN